MVDLQYRVWREGGLWHWRVLVLRGIQIGRGAATGMVRARAEAIAFAAAPKRAQDIDALQRAHSDRVRALAEQAVLESSNLRRLATAQMTELRASIATCRALVSGSSEKIARTRDLLRTPASKI